MLTLKSSGDAEDFSVGVFENNLLDTNKLNVRRITEIYVEKYWNMI